MPIQPYVYYVMIASPGDVPMERDAIEEAIYKWSSEFGEFLGLIFMPRRWEKHASPRQGTRGQEVVHEDLTRPSDVLVGLVWSTLGTPTEESLSGTVEEILEFHTSGKPHAILFCEKDVPRDADRSKLATVDAFKEDARRNRNSPFLGLNWSFKTKEELQDIVQRYLTRTAEEFINNPPAVSIVLKKDVPGVVKEVVSERNPESFATVVKSYILDPGQRISLDGFVLGETKRVYEYVKDEKVFPLIADIMGEEVDRRPSLLEDASSNLMAMYAVAGEWANITDVNPWMKSLSLLARFVSPSGTWNDPWERMRRYPAMLTLYAFGIAATASGKTDNLVRLLDLPAYDILDRPDGPLASRLLTAKVVDLNIQKELPGMRDNLVPLSLRLSKLKPLRSALSDVLPFDSNFLNEFDYFEYILGLCSFSLRGWAPSGIFMYRGWTNGDPGRMESALRLGRELPSLGFQHPLLKFSGLSGSVENLQSIKSQYESQLGRRLY